MFSRFSLHIPEHHENHIALNLPPCSNNHREKLKYAFPEKFTISSLVRWATWILQEHGIDSPSLDAEVLLSHLLSCKRIDLYVHPDKPVEDEIAIRYREFIQKRSQCTPLQYITNHTEFMSLDFYVDERVLIPRPETELLVDAVVKRVQPPGCENEILVVDIGVGSGNIAITLAKMIDKARIFAIDISPNALTVAQINAQRHEVGDKITFLRGDLFQPLEGYGIKLKADFIVSNPPYIASSEFNTLQKEVRDFEPYTALISGQDGLQMFKRIIADADRWLKPGGYVIFEVGEKQARSVARLFQDTGCFKKPVFVKDYQHIHRIVIAQLEESRG